MDRVKSGEFKTSKAGSKMLNILFLTSIYENFGGYYRCLNLGRCLSRRGFHVTLICASGRNFDLRIRKRKIAENFALITLPRIKYHRYFTGQILRMIISCIQVLVYQYDIMHAFTVAQPQVGIPAWVAKKIRRKKVIVDWEDLWDEGFARYHPFPVRKVLTFFEARIPFIADRITLVSKFLKRRTIELGLDRQKVHLIPNGCDIEQIKPLDRGKVRGQLKLKLETNIILAMGHTYLDSLGLLFEAFGLVLREISNVLLIMVGRVDIPEKFQGVYQQMANKVLLTGPKPFREVPLYLAVADVLVLPMDNDPIEKARFPMRFGDYLAAGRPIVSNAVGEVKYYLEKYKCGLTTGSTDVLEMAESILFLLNNREAGELLGRKARALAEGDLAWGKIADDLSQIY